MTTILQALVGSSDPEAALAKYLNDAQTYNLVNGTLNFLELALGIKPYMDVDEIKLRIATPIPEYASTITWEQVGKRCLDSIDASADEIIEEMAIEHDLDTVLSCLRAVNIEACYACGSWLTSAEVCADDNDDSLCVTCYNHYVDDQR